MKQIGGILEGCTEKAWLEAGLEYDGRNFAGDTSKCVFLKQTT